MSEDFEELKPWAMLKETRRSLAKDALKVLKGARKLLSDPDKWTTFSKARDAEENPVAVFDPYATKWCAMGAISRCAGSSMLHYQVAMKFMENYPKASIVSVNDYGGYEKVLAKMDETIAKIERRLNVNELQGSSG